MGEDLVKSKHDIGYIYKNYNSAITRQVRKSAWHQDDIEDIIQEVYLSLAAYGISDNQNSPHIAIRRSVSQAIKRYYDDSHRKDKAQRCPLWLQRMKHEWFEPDKLDYLIEHAQSDDGGLGSLEKQDIIDRLNALRDGGRYDKVIDYILWFYLDEGKPGELGNRDIVDKYKTVMIHYIKIALGIE